jgi:hypothetical protein
MAKQPEGNLSKFAQPKPGARAPRTIAPTKAIGETVATTVRFNRDDWNRLSEYARKNRISLQALVEPVARGYWKTTG